MHYLPNYPLAVFAPSFAGLWLATWTGAHGLRRRCAMSPDEREDFGVVFAAHWS